MTAALPVICLLALVIAATTALALVEVYEGLRQVRAISGLDDVPRTFRSRPSAQQSLSTGSTTGFRPVSVCCCSSRPGVRHATRSLRRFAATSRI
jgi:hypothetical protein